MPDIRVAVVEESEIFRRGITTYLDEAFGTAVLQSSDDPVLSVEVDLVVASGRAARQYSWQLPLVVCTDSAWSGAGTSRSSVLAVLPRAELRPEQLLGAVHAAAAGLRVEQNAVASPSFDTRQVAVLNMLADGAATRQISYELGYSERTIKTVIYDIERYLEARTRAEAVAKAIRMGII